MLNLFFDNFFVFCFNWFKELNSKFGVLFSSLKKISVHIELLSLSIFLKLKFLSISTVLLKVWVILDSVLKSLNFSFSLTEIEFSLFQIPDLLSKEQFWKLLKLEIIETISSVN